MESTNPEHRSAEPPRSRKCHTHADDLDAALQPVFDSLHLGRCRNRQPMTSRVTRRAKARTGHVHVSRGGRAPAPRVLSLKQPWAWAVSAGKKKVENRSWNTPYRGTVYIHASTKL